jgi:hypothetical protein
MKLNEAAKDKLREAGITQAAYARSQGFRDGRWRGDACGCPDDHCINYHHGANEECGCLPVLLAEVTRGGES